MHKLKQVFADRVRAGLIRHSIHNPAQWAEKHRILGGKDFAGPWRFTYHPWLKGMHESEAELNIGQKSAQMGYSEWALNMTFYKIDIDKTNCLYVLPNKSPDATDFSAGRFAPALELSQYLATLFSDTQNVGHKRAGTTSLYVRGSKSRSGLKSVPCGFIVLDELDEMNQENIPLVEERSSGQMTKQRLYISTPTIPGYGINKYFEDSTKEHFFFRCPCCSRLTELVFPECLKITAESVTDTKYKNSHLLCKECKSLLPHKGKTDWLTKAVWVPSYDNRDSRGFYINQMYSTTVSPAELARAYLLAQSSPADMQEFHNSKLGLTFVDANSLLTDKDIDECIGGFRTTHLSTPGKMVTIGVDVGKWLHYVCCEWYFRKDADATVDPSVYCRPKVFRYGKLASFAELNQLVQEIQPDHTVIDGNPERRLSYEFVTKFYGVAHMCFYASQRTGKQIHISGTIDLSANVDRAYWLDTVLNRLRNGKKAILLPIDTDLEFRQHMLNCIRVWKKDKDGNPELKIQHVGDDHYAHAMVYAEVAFQLASGVGDIQGVENPI